MSDILSRINRTKVAEVSAAKAQIALAEIKAMALDVPLPRDFLAAIHAKHAQSYAAVIAEIKKASPSKGLIRKDFHPAEIARSYERAGAACLSVLTDEAYFQGSPDYLHEAKNAVALPVLRKDFMIDPYQIYQARFWGADAVLLIAASLDTEQMVEMEGIAHDLGMCVLIELHDESEWKKCERLASPLFGVNNRNLRTFAVDMQQTVRLLPLLTDKTVVCESGIHTHEDIANMRLHGVHTFLVGEALMRQDNIEMALRLLLSGGYGI